MSISLIFSGKLQVQNVLSAIYVPAIHDRAAPGDSAILSGFADGRVGLWIPPYPTRSRSTYHLKQTFVAHRPGPLITLNDGSQVSRFLTPYLHHV